MRVLLRKFRRRVSNLFWGIRYRTTHKYHLLDLRDRHYGYKLGWIDRDEVLLIAAFRVLCEYVEREKPFEIIDWNWSEDSRHVASEIKALYHWWTVERPARNPANMATEAAFDRTDDEQLMRLVRIRRALWT